jgi:hypothetical protein
VAGNPDNAQDAGAVGPPDMQLVYANTAGIRGGAFDASLEFGYVIPQGGGEEPPVPIWAVRVAMSWEHLRALHTLMGEQLANYEAEVGKLPNIAKLKIGDANDDDR